MDFAPAGNRHLCKHGCERLHNLQTLRLIYIVGLWSTLANNQNPIGSCLRRVTSLEVGDFFFSDVEKRQGWQAIRRLAELTQLSKLHLIVLNEVNSASPCNRNSALPLDMALDRARLDTDNASPSPVGPQPSHPPHGRGGAFLLSRHYVFTNYYPGEVVRSVVKLY